jgi:hypothetical protein
MVFGKAVPKGSPVIGRHKATATSGALDFGVLGFPSTVTWHQEKTCE